MIQLKKGIKILIGAILVLGVATYAVYAAIIASNPSPEDRCTHIELNIEQNPHSGFITNEIIENELHKANIYPKERLLADIRTRDIEKTLMKNEFIEQVECYKTANNTVTINIKQRTPVIYILPDNGKGYYIDKYGKIITKTNYPVNLPVATGIMSEAYATKCLSKLGAYIVNDEFWNSQIEQIYVKANADREYVIDLIPRVGNHVIHLGHITNFENKLHRLMVFYEKALSQIGWNKYSSIDLEYEGQIICKK
jgi:cell division protein FtsQ